MNVIEILNNHIKNKGIKRSYIAKKVGVCNLTITYLLNMETRMKYDTFLKVLDALDFSIINENNEEVELHQRDIIPQIMLYMKKNRIRQNKFAEILEISKTSLSQFMSFTRSIYYNKFIQILLLTGFKIVDSKGNIVLGEESTIQQDIEDHYYLMEEG